MKTGKGLVEYAKAQLGNPYWWGTFGNTANQALLSYKRSQYPSYYTASDFEQQFGKRVHDCVGLIKGYLWSDTPDSEPKYNPSQDVAVSGLYINCSKTGTLSTMPEIPGICVFMSSLGHVGVYIGGGWVIEAQGHATGVVKTALKGRGWSLWGMPKWIDYTETDETSEEPSDEPVVEEEFCKIELPTLKLKNKDRKHTKLLQRQLIAMGYNCGGSKDRYGKETPDGDFGNMTSNAVKNLQQKNNIPVSGEVDERTWPIVLDY